MKFFLSFAGVLVAILLLVRFVPTAPINPVLPIGPQKEVNGHNANVPNGASGEADENKEENEKESEETPGNTRVAPVAPGQTYGATISPDGAVPMSALNTALGNRDSAQVKLSGKASAVCQARGCWLTLPTANGEQMRVRFRDYAFFVPKDLSGHTIVVSGWAHRSTVPKADLQHYAKDAGKSDQEIAAITEDEQQLTFLADGVLVRD